MRRIRWLQRVLALQTLVVFGQRAMRRGLLQRRVEIDRKERLLPGRLRRKRLLRTRVVIVLLHRMQAESAHQRDKSKCACFSVWAGGEDRRQKKKKKSFG
jgi:hypothetical protein